MAEKLLGSRIRARREVLGLKQRDVAARAGISASYLNLIEHNRRGIAGKVLIDIAAALDLEVSALLEGSDSEVHRRLQNAAAANSAARPELARTQEFIARFPGWARLTAGLEQQAARLERRINDLSDRLAHDPFLAESLHEILSSVTAIHATSGILAQADEMEALQRRRFQANIHEESARLSHLSRALVGYFNPDSLAEEIPATPLDEVEAFLAAHAYHFTALEQAQDDHGARRASARVLTRAPEQGKGQGQGQGQGRQGQRPELSADARRIATGVVRQMAEDARALPLAEFLAAARASGYDPLTLARRTGAAPSRIMRRLAFLPTTEAAQGQRPEIGLVSCDGTGAVLLRKPLAGFPLPRYGSACALWPLYQAMARPHLPLSMRLATPEGRLFQSYAYAEYADPNAPVPVLRATMILSEERAGPDAQDAQDVLRVGQSCRICPRDDCAARREPSIHGAVHGAVHGAGHRAVR